jgi:hypothetical protein
MNDSPEARDVRAYAESTNRRLLLGGLLLIIVVGIGLIAWIYGWGAARMGLVCVGLGLAPVLLIGLILLAMDWLVRRADRG